MCLLWYYAGSELCRDERAIASPGRFSTPPSARTGPPYAPASGERERGWASPCSHSTKPYAPAGCRTGPPYAPAGCRAVTSAPLRLGPRAGPPYAPAERAIASPCSHSTLPYPMRQPTRENCRKSEYAPAHSQHSHPFRDASFEGCERWEAVWGPNAKPRTPKS